jgi:hypothetical protein
MKKSEFVANAKPIVVNINGVPLEAKPRQFKSDKKSVGYYVNGKVPITLPDGTVGKLQVNANLTVCGSGEWEQGEELKEAA